MSIERIFLDAEPHVYADVVIVDDKTLYLSGLVSWDPVTEQIVDGDIATQTKYCMLQLKDLLEKNGSDMDHVVRVDVMLNDFSERDEMNAEYLKHFKQEHMPARVCYGVNGLADDLKIEIMAIAVKK